MSKDVKIVLIVVVLFITFGIGFVLFRKKYPNGFSLGAGGTAAALAKSNALATSPGAAAAAGITAAAAATQTAAQQAQAAAAAANANKTLAGGILGFAGGLTTALSNAFTTQAPDPTDASFLDTGTDTTNGYTEPGAGDLTSDSVYDPTIDVEQDNGYNDAVSVF